MVSLVITRTEFALFLMLLAPLVREVIGIEDASSAVHDAEHNGRDLPNVRFIQAKTEDALGSVLGAAPRSDGVVLDPAEQVVSRDLLEHLGMVGAHVLARTLDDVVVGLAANDLAAFARDLLRHHRPLSSCPGGCTPAALGLSWRELGADADDCASSIAVARMGPQRCRSCLKRQRRRRGDQSLLFQDRVVPLFKNPPTTP